jgi:KDEL-tailed cysteine endopeptidase
MRQAVLTLATIGATIAASVEEPNMIEFMRYIGQHQKSYATMDEFQVRMGRWHRADKYIRAHSETPDAEHFSVGHNKFSDYTEAEYKSMMGLKRRAKNPARLWTAQKNETDIRGPPLPVSIDWRERHAVTPVKDQGQCGSCWAFATAACLEGAHAINTGQLFSFSEQLFVSCVKDISDYGEISEPQPCCNGCEGGDNDAAWAWAGNNSISLVLETDMRYQMANGICDYDSRGKTRVQVQSYTDIPANNPTFMKIALSHQPIAIGVDASELPFQTYKNGIITSDDCYKTSDHAITAVGYGVSPQGLEFWIVKNSWGNDWGENGYVRIWNSGKDDVGVCGINEDTSFPTTIEIE